MEFQISADELRQALYRAQGIVEKKSTMPILATVLIQARVTPEGGRVSVTAYDLEVGVSGEHAAEVLREGSVAVHARSLYEIARNLPENVVRLKKGANNRIEVSSGTAEFKVVGQDPDEFPALPRLEGYTFAPVESGALLEMIEKTSFAMSSDETRYNLNGVLFDPRESGTRMVATDGHRLALIEKPLAASSGLTRGVIIPRKGLMELRRLLAEETSVPGELAFNENSGVYRRQGLVLVMRLVDGQFPNYDQVIPGVGESPLPLPRARLLEMLRRVALMASDKASSVTVELGPNLLRATSRNPELGEAREDMVIEYAGAPMKVAFNARYLQEVLSAIETDQVMFDMADELSPCVLRPSDNGGYLSVIMPMRA